MCVRFQFLKDHQDKYNIKRACKTLNISRSGFYEYLQRKKSNCSVENKSLSKEVKRVFEEHKGEYGSLESNRSVENKSLRKEIKGVFEEYKGRYGSLESNCSVENKLLSKEIKEVFEEHKGGYGSLRISKSLEAEGLNVNHKRVGKLMHSMGLYAKGARYRYKYCPNG